jgi:hypothetical protein
MPAFQPARYAAISAEWAESEARRSARRSSASWATRRLAPDARAQARHSCPTRRWHRSRRVRGGFSIPGLGLPSAAQPAPPSCASEAGSRRAPLRAASDTSAGLAGRGLEEPRAEPLPLPRIADNNAQLGAAGASGAQCAMPTGAARPRPAPAPQARARPGAPVDRALQRVYGEAPPAPTKRRRGCGGHARRLNRCGILRRAHRPQRDSPPVRRGRDMSAAIARRFVPGFHAALDDAARWTRGGACPGVKSGASAGTGVPGRRGPAHHRYSSASVSAALHAPPGAAATRCPQEVREQPADPESGSVQTQPLCRSRPPFTPSEEKWYFGDAPRRAPKVGRLPRSPLPPQAGPSPRGRPPPGPPRKQRSGPLLNASARASRLPPMPPLRARTMALKRVSDQLVEDA